ncbi:MAG: hypothetical protein Q7S95_00885 [bacterium]|nr:hypothetical protein [bacterium]
MRTLEDIIPPSRRPVQGAGESNTGSPPVRAPSRRGGRFPFITVLVALAIIGGSVVVLLRFSGAKVEVIPTTVSIPVQGSFTAGDSASVLPYQLITSKKVATESVTTSGTKQVSSSASGPMTIYNTQAKPQKLVASTRFASSAGLIFRIRSAVTVPSGSATKPGSVVATVYADQPGPSYNIDASSFTVPGLAGTSQASAVYGRSTAPMTGGASGLVPSVDPAAEKTAVASAEGTLATELADNLKSQVPVGYTLVQGGSATSYRELTLAPSTTTGQADIQVEGTITGVVFKTTALASAILARAGNTDLGDSGATLGQGTTLTLSSISAFPTADTDSFTFTLSGTTAVVAVVDKSRIASAVAGKSRSEAQTALTGYPEVKRAIIVLRPFWRQTFPEDPTAITVSVTQGERPLGL